MEGATIAEAVAAAGLGAGALPVAVAVGGSLLAAGALGGVIGGGAGVAQNLEARLGTGFHFVSDGLQNLAAQSGALWAKHFLGADARGPATDLNRHRAAWPDRMVRLDMPDLGYEHARHQAVIPLASQALRGAEVGTMPSTAPPMPPPMLGAPPPPGIAHQTNLTHVNCRTTLLHHQEDCELAIPPIITAWLTNCQPPWCRSILSLTAFR